MFSRKIGAEGSVLQELFLFVILIIRCIFTDSDSTYFVKLVFALYFDSFCLILLKVTPHLTIRQCHLLGTSGLKGQHYKSCLFVILTMRCLHYD